MIQVGGHVFRVYKLLLCKILWRQKWTFWGKVHWKRILDNWFLVENLRTKATDITKLIKVYHSPPSPYLPGGSEIAKKHDTTIFGYNTLWVTSDHCYSRHGNENGGVFFAVFLFWNEWQKNNVNSLGECENVRFVGIVEKEPMFGLFLLFKNILAVVLWEQRRNGRSFEQSRCSAW